ncbi:MAG: hypothetical protein MUD14_08200, partial [Hydrococcus sp. Prado102]|nr:hypothetical protein [Hydrococcus sp. Prado102]
MYVWNKATLTADHSVSAQRLTYWPQEHDSSLKLQDGVRRLSGLIRKNQSLLVSEIHTSGNDVDNFKVLDAAKFDRSLEEKESRSDRPGPTNSTRSSGD